MHTILTQNVVRSLVVRRGSIKNKLFNVQIVVNFIPKEIQHTTKELNIVKITMSQHQNPKQNLISNQIQILNKYINIILKILKRI
jgi:hypothetical protein